MPRGRFILVVSDYERFVMNAEEITIEIHI
jgi:hypothetical protein